VIRGAFGVIYSNGISTAFGTQNGAISAPAFANFVAYNGDFTGKTPAFILSKGAPPLNIPAVDFAKKENDQFLGTTVGGFLNGDSDPYPVQWSFYVERQLPANIGLSVGYVGTHGMHLFGDEFRNYDHVPTAVRQQLRYNINNSVPTDPALGAIYGCGTACAGYLVMRPYPQYTGVTINTNPDGYNRYNSFQVKLEKRYSHGLDLIAAYTIQKNLQSPQAGSTLGNSAVPTTLGRSVGRTSLVPGGSAGGVPEHAGVSGAYQNPDNRRADTSLSPDDIPQILNLAATYELPFGPGKRFFNGTGLAKKMIGGWTWTQNWNFQKGVPLVFVGPCNGLTSAIGVCRPNLVGDPSRGRGSKSRLQLQNQYFDPSAFQAVFGGDPAVIKAVSTGLNPDGTSFNCHRGKPLVRPVRLEEV
jgi:hypothetical protein